MGAPVLVIAVAFCLYLFPLEFIAGQGPYWDNIRADGEISVIGMRYFLADQWRFPILQTHLLMPPDGVNIIYTDSVPLMALIAKTLLFLLPTELNYFGMWYVMAYVLQAIAAVYFIRALAVTAVVPQVAAAVMALSFPALLFRTTLHASLTGHFLILWALGLYFTAVRGTAFRRMGIWFACAVWAALLVHAYIFVMVLAIFGAGAAQHMASSRRGLREGATIVALVLSSIALLMWLVGYFAGAGATLGFGYYSMNLLSPLVPQRSGLFPGMQGIVDATGGQHEGFNYLGVGALLLLATAVWITRASLPAIARKYWALSLVLGGFMLLAVSNRVFAGRWSVLDIGSSTVADTAGRPSDPGVGAAADRADSAPRTVVGVVKGALQQVRSSGRLFWPIGYVLLIGSLAMVATRLPGAIGLTIVIVAVTLQLLDTGPLRREIRDKFGGRVSFAAMPATLQFPPDVRWHDAKIGAMPWRPLIGAHRTLRILPSFECAGFERRWDVLDLVFQASATATPANTAYLARRTHPTDCSQEQQTTLRRHGIQPGELLVILTPVVSKWSVAMLPGFRDSCRSFAQGFACSQSWNVPIDSANRPAFAPFPGAGQAATYLLGTGLDFAVGGNSRPYQTYGWSVSGTKGALLDGPEAGLEFHLKQEETDRALTMTVRAEMRGPVDGTSALVLVRIDGAVAERWTLPQGTPTELVATIARLGGDRLGRVRVDLEVLPERPSPGQGSTTDTQSPVIEIMQVRIDGNNPPQRHPRTNP